MGLKSDSWELSSQLCQSHVLLYFFYKKVYSVFETEISKKMQFGLKSHSWELSSQLWASKVIVGNLVPNSDNPNYFLFFHKNVSNF